MASKDSEYAPPPLEVQRAADGTTIVTLRGEHDLNSRDELAAALTNPERVTVLLDATECAFIDSTIISVILSANRELVSRGGRLALILPPEASLVSRIAKLTRLAEILPVYASRAHAAHHQLRAS